MSSTQYCVIVIVMVAYAGLRHVVICGGGGTRDGAWAPYVMPSLSLWWWWWHEGGGGGGDGGGTRAVP
ncbi:hypothetical protein OG21DRAFT_1491988 [Imleria badia]|nr:hypothetical protein OG21DRAFT_1491988 [Imleria badia]